MHVYSLVIFCGLKFHVRSEISASGIQSSKLTKRKQQHMQVSYSVSLSYFQFVSQFCVRCTVNTKAGNRNQCSNYDKAVKCSDMQVRCAYVLLCPTHQSIRITNCSAKNWGCPLSFKCLKVEASNNYTLIFIQFNYHTHFRIYCSLVQIMTT
jgi:hypothetical protein